MEYPQRMVFEEITDGKEVGLGETEAILMDHEGFMWLGGRNHLIRYDGKRFVNILTETINEAGEPELGNSLQNISLFEDRDNTLWVGTRGGLLRYNREREVLERVKSSLVEMKYATITAIRQASNGTLYLTSYLGLFSIEPGASAIERVFDLSGALDITGLEMSDIVIKGDTAWLGTIKGIATLNLNNLTAALYTPSPANGDSVTHNYAKTIEFDRNGLLWVGVAKGVYAFNPQDKSFKFYQPDGSLSGLSAGIIEDIHLDHDGLLWIGSDSQGLSLYDEYKDQFIRFDNMPGDKTTLSSSVVRSIAHDNNGDLWVGTYPSGVNYHDRSSNAVRVLQNVPGNPQSIGHTAVEFVLEDREGKLWIGTKSGLTVYDRQVDTYTHFTVENGKTPTNGVISGFIDSDGDIWIGTWANGLLKYDPVLDKLVQIPFDENGTKLESITAGRLNDAYVWSIREDAQKQLWVATHNGALSKFDKKTGSFTNYISGNLNNIPQISSALVWTTLEDSVGRFWVGTAGGLTLFDKSTGRGKRYYADPQISGALVNMSILSIHEDKKQRVWFGTDGGLHLYHPDTDSFSVYGADHGFVDSGIRVIVEDPHGNLWLGTNNGIIKFNPETESVENFTAFNGKPIGGIDTNVGLYSKRGELIFGGANGVLIYDINRFGVNTVPPPVAFTDLNLFTKKVLVGDDTQLLKKSLNKTGEITFDYMQNMFSIEFSALNFKQPEKNQYAYKMEGFDKEWRNVGNQNVAVYTNLSPGKYTFRIKASNNDGVWNEQGKAIAVYQLPPPWLTWWAKFLYILIILAILAAYASMQYKKRKRIEEQNHLLELKVMERTLELNTKTDDIQAMLSNMSQGLFTIQRDGTVHQEYSKYLEVIFNTDQIAGRRASELLFDSLYEGSNKIDQAEQAVVAILGEDGMGFEFNSHLLMTQYKTEIDGINKYLEVDWNPIFSGQVVDKLMVSVRDVTALRNMKEEAQEKRREVDIILQIIDIPSDKIKQFMASATHYIQENREAITEGDVLESDLIAFLFRNVHTIKGNSRTFGFTHLSDVVHDVETYYSDLKESPHSADVRGQLLEGLDQIEKQLNEYQQVYASIMGRHPEPHDEGRFSASLYEKIKGGMLSFFNRYPEYAQDKGLRSAYIALEAGNSHRLSDVLADISSALSRMANHLGKTPPEILLKDHGIRIKDDRQELLRNVFTHILRNCLDHGIEMPEERAALGKPSKGKISIESNKVGGDVEFTIFDDGRGVHLAKLFDDGLDLRMWNVDDSPSAQTIADLMFESGVSTKEVVTNISGRGVGMDAVKQFLLDSGGKVSLVLENGSLANASEMPTFMPFKLVISVPGSFCVGVKKT